MSIEELSRGPQRDRWMEIEPITLTGDKIFLPSDAPPVSGLYRLDFPDQTSYFGESGNIKRRLGDYHSPGQGCEAEYRIHKALRALGGARVFVQTDGDFSTRTLRCQRESSEIEDATRSGKTILNGGETRQKIAFYEAEIERLKRKLHPVEDSQGADNWHQDMRAYPIAGALSISEARLIAKELGLSAEEMDHLYGSTVPGKEQS